MAEEIPETNIILPRNYGVVIQSGSNTFFYDPARYAIGYAMLMTQAELQNALKKWQVYKRDETAKLQDGNLPYNIRFPIDGLEDLMVMHWEEAEEKIIAGIEKKEGAKNLWLVGGKPAIKDAKLYGGGNSTLEGDVKSKTSGYNHVYIGNPFLTPEGFIQHRQTSCTEKGQKYEGGAKRLISICSHAAALETAQFMQLKGIREFDIDYGKRNMKWKDPTLAFDFVSQNYLSNLIIDILVERYVRKESLYRINRKLMEGEIRDALFSPALDNTAKTGKVRYAVMRQDTKRYGRSKSYQTEENQWLRKVKDKLKERGYEKMPFYAIAFLGSEHETIAERWENGNRVVEIACNFDDAPLIIRKDIKGDVMFHTSSPPYPGNPFLRMGGEEKAIDGCTARHCTQHILSLDDLMKIEVLGRRMAESMQQHYRGSILRAGRKEQEKQMPEQLDLF